ncbi:dynein associated protein-domain-containing protein [Pyrenochaeta sp. MPI-SDFR-AT-0127]|nr:dynein associated protein-domain-containing protein [Pyrenochaeta sp. MPI-SDFR-AT-0127]
MADFKIGQTVETSTHQHGVVKYVGPIHVSDGIFLGIELPTATGKNDGSVRGERYFTCVPAHGLFVKESSIIRIVSQPAPPTPAAITQPATPRSRPPVAAPRPRPSSVIAPKPAARASTISKRQSVAPSTTYNSLRTPLRKPSITSASTTSAAEPSVRVSHSGSRPSISSTTSQGTLKSSRDTNVETLQTKIRHLERQHSEAQERLKELAQIKDERDRYHSILQKLQTKIQTQHVEAQELKENLKNLQEDNERLFKSQQEHEVDLEDALVDKEMAEERADQAEAEIESLQKRVEERDLELDILREEAELFTTEMTEDQKQEVGYYRLQHENERLRNALVVLKEMTEEKEQDFKATILGLEADASQLEAYESEHAELHERVTQSDAIIEDLKQRLDAANEWEDMVGELSTQNQDFQDRIAEQDLVIEDLENLRELNDELEAQHIEQEADLRDELEAKDIELAEQQKKITEQQTSIAEHEFLVSKFRDLVFDLQSRMTDAESERTMTEAQVKDTAGRFNEVMDLNRRLRAANVHATTKEISSELRILKADETTEQLNMQSLYLETGPREFSASEPIRAYFTAKRITFKTSLESSLIVNLDRQLSYNGGLEEALSRLLCVEAVYHLSNLAVGATRLSSAMAVSSLPQFAIFGPTYEELVAVEKAVDQGLDALKADEVNFAELAASLGRSARIQENVLVTHQEALDRLPEDETSSRFRSIVTSLEYLDATFAVVNTMLRFLASNSEELADEANNVLEQFATPSATCKAALLAAQKVVKTVEALREDSLYPQFPGGLEDVIEYDTGLAKAAHEAAQWAQTAVKAVSISFDQEADSWLPEAEVRNLKLFYWSNQLYSLDTVVSRLTGWNEHASVLMNSIEIEHGPAPWTQKAQEVEAARRKSTEAAVQLQNLTAEHRATVLKIHEREQAIATKELEIEHLVAKNRDIAAKAEDVEALQAELTRRHDKIVELETNRRALTLEMETLRERAARAEQSVQNETASSTLNPTARVEPVEQPSMSRRPPAGLKSMIDALQNENHWLRQRQHADALDRNLKHVFSQMSYARDQEQHKLGIYPEMIDDILDVSWLSDDDEELDAVTPSGVSSQEVGRKMSALALEPVSMGSRLTWEEDYEMLSMIEEEQFSMIYP